MTTKPVTCDPYFTPLAEIGTDIEKAASLLDKGKLVAIPTETVYGLAGNALNDHAVASIFQVKNRPAFDPLIVHVRGKDHLTYYVENIPPIAEQLIDRFWPGPLTLLLPKKSIIPDLVTSGLARAGFRCPNHTLTLQLLSRLNFPLAAPSANPFGYISPTEAFHVENQLGDKIDYILDGGPCTVGVESTIIGFESGEPIIYRLGGISLEEIESVIGNVKFNSSNSKPAAPGQLESHYAPKKKMVLGDVRALMQQSREHSYGILSFDTDYGAPVQRILSPSGDVIEAARNLFRYMRELDTESVSVIFCEKVPDEGLGRAINDRLKRACA